MLYGTIHAPDGWSYRLTAEDVLWAARAALCEDSSPEGTAAVLWTWTQRYALPGFRDRFPTFRSLVRAHSQPVNPIWARTGSRCRPGGAYAGSTHCSETRLRRREACARRGWGDMPEPFVALVTRWAKGRLPNPVPGAVDFAAASVSQQSGDELLYRIGGQRFYSEAASRRRRPATIEGPSIVGPLLLGLVGVAAAGYAGLTLARKLDR